MSYALNTLKELLGAKATSATPQQLGVVLSATPMLVNVATQTGITSVTPQGILHVGDRVMVEGTLAYSTQDITTEVSV